jgi:hypothetical protein
VWRSRIKEVDVTYSASNALRDEDGETIPEEYAKKDDGTPIDKTDWEYDAWLREKARLKREHETIAKKKSELVFSEPLAIEICERVSSGELFISLCVDEHMPTVRRVTQWLRESPEFAALYKDSISDRLTIFEEEVIKIADDASRDFRDVVRNGRTARVLDGEAIARAKLRVEVRLKHLKAYKPSIWGEQSTLNVKQSDTTDMDNMTTEELAAKIAELEHKDRVVNEDRRSRAAA